MDSYDREEFIFLSQKDTWVHLIHYYLNVNFVIVPERSPN